MTYSDVTMDKNKILQNIYDEIPSFQCKEGCSDCCGPVILSKYESDRLKGKETNTGVGCRYLKDGKCSVYEIRPFICRIFGVLNDLKCPHIKPAIMLNKHNAEKLKTEYTKAFFDDGEPVYLDAKLY